MKEFQYDVLLERENICNRSAEIKAIDAMMSRRQRVVLYAPRRYGKTSLAKNVVVEDFRSTHKKSVVIFADMMDVASYESVLDRLNQAVSRGIAQSFPVKAWAASVVGYFKNVQMAVSIDPLTNMPSLEIKGDHAKPAKGICELFAGVKKLCDSHRVLLVIDEFQDLAAVPEVLGVMRNALQDLGKCSVLILGSKQSLLSQIFGSAHSPFFGYGDEMSLGPIAIDDWLPYFNDRLSHKSMRIERETLVVLADLMCDVPNAICEAGFWLYHHGKSRVVRPNDVGVALGDLVSNKEQSYRSQLAFLSTKEKSVLQSIARRKYVSRLASKAFLKEVETVASSTKKIVDKLASGGLIEWELDKGYRLSNPLLRHFLVRFSL